MSNARAGGRHRAAPARRPRSELVLAIGLAAVLAAVVGAAAIIGPKVFGSADSAQTTPSAQSSTPSTAMTTTASPSTTTSASPAGLLPTSAVNNACTYEILAVVDTRIARKSTATAVIKGSTTDILAVALQQNFQALLKAKKADVAVRDAIAMARQMCDQSGNPLLTREQVEALKKVAARSDLDLLNSIVSFAPSIGTPVSVPTSDAVQSGSSKPTTSPSTSR